MAQQGFTQIDNKILDLGLSMEALGLYLQIKRHSTKQNWIIRRDFCKSISGMGETAFRRVWKELQDKGLLKSERTREKGKFVYNFSLVCPLEAKEIIKEEVKTDTNIELTQEQESELKSEYGLVEYMKAKNYVDYMINEKNAAIKNLFSYTSKVLSDKLYITYFENIDRDLYMN